MSRIYLGIIFNPVDETRTKRKRKLESKRQRLGAGRGRRQTHHGRRNLFLLSGGSVSCF